MVCPTRLQSTFRTEKYNNTPARRLERTHDRILRRLPPPEDASLGSSMRILLFHKGVGNHVQHDHMKIFDSSGMRMGNRNIQFR